MASSRLAIKDQIETLIGTISNVKTFEIWNSQIDHEDEEHPIVYPAVFLEYSVMDWNPQTFQQVQNYTPQQEGQFEITLHCCFETLADNITYFDNMDSVLDEIYRAVTGQLDDNIINWMRIRELQDINHDGVQDWQMLFVSGVTDGGVSMDLVDATDGGLVTIDIEILKEIDIDNIIIRTGDGTF